MTTTDDRFRDSDPVATRIVRLLHERRVSIDGTVDTVLAQPWWLPPPSAGLDALWDGLVELREGAENAHDELEQASETVAAARSRLSDVDELRATAARTGIDVELPSRRDAEEAIEDALLRLDGARQRYAVATVDAFVRVRELEGEWRAVTGEVRTPLEDRRAELLREVAELEARLRGIAATGPLLDSLRDAWRLRPWSAIVEGLDHLATQHEPTVAEHAAAVSGDPVVFTDSQGEETVFARPGQRYTGRAIPGVPVPVDPALERQVTEWQPDRDEAEAGAARAAGFASAEAAADEPVAVGADGDAVPEDRPTSDPTEER